MNKFPYLTASVLAGLWACDSTPPVTGTFGADFGGNAMRLAFADGGKVRFTMTESGHSESADCSFSQQGERVTIRCPEADGPMQLSWRDGTLEGDMGEGKFTLTRR